MKRKLILIWLVIMMLALGACSGTDTKETGTPKSETVETSKDAETAENTNSTAEEETAAADAQTEENTVAAEETAKETEPSVETLGPEAFDKLLMELPVSIIKTKYTVQDEKYKSLYPDLLQAVLQNNTDEDIKSAVVAFVAWDKNGLPVKITGYLSFGGGSYVKEVEYGDINLAAGSTYGDEGGLQLDDSTEDIDTFKAVVASYETFEGSTWENPYYDAFCKLYGEKKLNPEATVEVKVEKTENNSSNTAKSGDKNKEKQDDKDLPSEKELADLLKAEPVFIKSTKYIVQDENYKTLYPDMLQAVIQNNTKEDIKSAMVAFAAWDKNGLPVKIKGHLSFVDGVYIAEVDYSDINLAAGGTYGKDSGFQLDENLEIETFKAIVVSYETYDGTEWENPHYKNFCSLYEGKKQKK